MTDAGKNPTTVSALQAPIKLKLPDGVVPALYDRVRRDARLGPALDTRLIPALESAGSAESRIGRFQSARAAAIAEYQDAAKRGEPVLTPEEQASKATGPGPHPALAAFDRVCTDVLRAWFIGWGEAVAAATSVPVDARIATLQDLEARAKDAFRWEPQAAESVAVRVMLVRTALKK